MLSVKFSLGQAYSCGTICVIQAALSLKCRHTGLLESDFQSVLHMRLIDSRLNSALKGSLLILGRILMNAMGIPLYHLSTYAFRHQWTSIFASMLLNAGEETKKIQLILGWNWSLSWESVTHHDCELN